MPHERRPEVASRDRFVGAIECDFIPRDVWADAQAQVSDDLDHERDITLAIHAAIPDLIKDTQMPRYPGWQLMALARQFERNSRAKPAWQGKIQTAARRRYNSKGPFDDG